MTTLLRLSSHTTTTNNLPSPIVTTPSPVNGTNTTTNTLITTVATTSTRHCSTTTTTTNHQPNLSLASCKNETIFISSGGDVIVCRCRDSSYPFGKSSTRSSSSSASSKTSSTNKTTKGSSSNNRSSSNYNNNATTSSSTATTMGWNSYMWRSSSTTANADTNTTNGSIRPSMNDLTNCCNPHNKNNNNNNNPLSSSNDTVATTSLEIDDLSCHVQTHAAGAAFCNPWVSSSSSKTKTKSSSSHSRNYSSGGSISSQVLLEAKRTSGGGGGLLGGAPLPPEFSAASPVIVVPTTTATTSAGGSVGVLSLMNPENDYTGQQQRIQRQVHYEDHDMNDTDNTRRFPHYNQYIDVVEEIGSDDDEDDVRDDDGGGSCILPIQSFDHTHFYEDDVSTTTSYVAPPSTRNYVVKTKNNLTKTSKSHPKSNTNNNNKIMDTTARTTNTSNKNYHSPTKGSSAILMKSNNNNNNNTQPSPSSLLRFVVDDVKMVPSPEMIHGVPTFLNSFQTVKIQMVSAHPLGSHVLLISNAGLLFSYGLNDYGQLGVGFQSNVKDRHRGYVMTPTIVVPLVENGGKAIACAAGVSHSLVVVETEEQRLIKHHSSSHHPTTSTTTTSNGGGGGGGPMDTSATSSTAKYYHRSNTTNTTTTTTTSGDNNNNNERNNNNNDTSPSASQQSSSSTTEYHHQLYGFGRNDYMKIGLINPRLSKQQQQQKLQQLKVTVSSTGNANNNNEIDEMEVTVLPRRVALRCRVHPEHHHSPGSNSSSSGVHGGIFAIEASVTHSAALVRRSSGAVDLYTWGNASQYALGLPTSTTTVIPGTTPITTNTTSTAVSKNNNKSTARIVPVPSIVPQLSTSGRSTKTTTSPSTTDVPSGPSLLLQEQGEYPCQISLGPTSTYVVTSLGRCFAFGTSDGGMLGHGPTIKEQRIPKVVVFPPPTIGGDDSDIIKSVHAGASHVVATTTSGIVYGWGNKSYCGLLQEADPQQNAADTPESAQSANPIITTAQSNDEQQQQSNIAWIPTEIDIGCSSQISSSCTKENATRNHLAAATNVFVTNVCVGYDSSYFVADTGKVYSCGKPSGRLGQGECSTDHVGSSTYNNNDKKNTKSPPTTPPHLPPQPLFGGIHLFWNPKGRYVSKSLQQQQQGNKQPYMENGSLSQYPTKTVPTTGNIILPPPPPPLPNNNNKSQLRHSSTTITSASATSTETLLQQRSHYNMKKHTSV